MMYLVSMFAAFDWKRLTDSKGFVLLNELSRLQLRKFYAEVYVTHAVSVFPAL
jgi:hypothetical protein